MSDSAWWRLMPPESSPLSTTSAGLPWKVSWQHCRGIHLRCGSCGGRGQWVKRAGAGLGSLHPFHSQSVSCWPCGATCVQSRRSKGTRCGTTSTWLPWILRRPSRCASRCSESSAPKYPASLQTPVSLDPIPQTLLLSLWLFPSDFLPIPGMPPF